jgi:hypothetical protein
VVCEPVVLTILLRRVQGSCVPGHVHQACPGGTARIRALLRRVQDSRLARRSGSGRLVQIRAAPGQNLRLAVRERGPRSVRQRRNATAGTTGYAREGSCPIIGRDPTRRLTSIACNPEEDPP